MFLLYAVLCGLIVGLLLRGDPRRLADLQFHWMPVVFLGFAFQVVLFSDFVTGIVGDLGPPLYVGSTVAVLVAILRNWRLTGIPLVALGSISNLTAILANGGYMPASAEAMASLGKTPPVVYSNSALLANPAFAPLTDIFALPRWLPFANVFSIGDVLIALGVVWVIVATMRTTAPQPSGAAHTPSGALTHLSLVTDSTGTDRPFADPNASPRLRSEGQLSSVVSPSRANPS